MMKCWHNKLKQLQYMEESGFCLCEIPCSLVVQSANIRGQNDWLQASFSYFRTGTRAVGKFFLKYWPTNGNAALRNPLWQPKDSGEPTPLYSGLAYSDGDLMMWKQGVQRFARFSHQNNWTSQELQLQRQLQTLSISFFQPHDTFIHSFIHSFITFHYSVQGQMTYRMYKLSYKYRK
jgi:hypothetical protein